MNRRSLMKLASSAGFATLMTKREAAAQEQVARATRAMPSPKIKDIQVIATAPTGLRLIVVKVITDQDGLYGYGCGTYTQRADLVVPAVEKYLKPVFVAQTTDLGNIDEVSKSINYSALARKLNIADGSTVKMHLTRYVERFRPRKPNAP